MKWPGISTRWVVLLFCLLSSLTATPPAQAVLQQPPWCADCEFYDAYEDWFECRDYWGCDRYSEGDGDGGGSGPEICDNGCWMHQLPAGYFGCPEFCSSSNPTTCANGCTPHILSNGVFGCPTFCTTACPYGKDANGNCLPKPGESCYAPCANYTCINATCRDSCGNEVYGTILPKNTCAQDTCVGSTCQNNCGFTLAGMKNCPTELPVPPDPDCYAGNSSIAPGQCGCPVMPKTLMQRLMTGDPNVGCRINAQGKTEVKVIIAETLPWYIGGPSTAGSKISVGLVKELASKVERVMQNCTHGTCGGAALQNAIELMKTGHGEDSVRIVVVYGTINGGKLVGHASVEVTEFTERSMSLLGTLSWGKFYERYDAAFLVEKELGMKIASKASFTIAEFIEFSVRNGHVILSPASVPK